MSDEGQEIQEKIEQADEEIKPYNPKRRLKQNRLERRARKTKIWLERFRVLLRISMIVFLIWFGWKLLKLPQWYMAKDAFNNADNVSLEILNNKIVPSYKILAALRRNKVPTKPIYMVETGDIKNSLMHLEPIEEVYIRRFWFPARIQVIIQERVPVITISPSPEVEPVAFFARGGKLIGRDYLPLDKSFKTIRVISYGTRGDDYRNWTVARINLIEKISKAVEAHSKEHVEFIDYRNPNDVYVKVKTANIRLGKIDDSVFSRIKRISSILPQVKLLDKKIKYVDLRWDSANYIKLE